MKYTLLLLFSFTISSMIQAQSTELNKEAYEEQYKYNIKQTRIDGTFIPGTAEEAIKILKSISPEEGLDNFAQFPNEVEASKKMHFGVGRWMIVNWNFYDGSRLSHALKEKGILHPDDMAQFLLIALHRDLNGKTLDSEALINDLAEKRKAIAEKLIETKRKL